MLFLPFADTRDPDSLLQAIQAKAMYLHPPPLGVPLFISVFLSCVPSHPAVSPVTTRTSTPKLSSCCAQVTRDRMMQELDRQYPQYGLGQHKGYGVSEAGGQGGGCSHRGYMG